jgi:hypothetical protein
LGEAAQGDLLARYLEAAKRQDRRTNIEVRVSSGEPPPIHDRFLIQDENVWLLGSSLNSFGERGTMAVLLADPTPVKTMLAEEWERASDRLSLPEVRCSSATRLLGAISANKRPYLRVHAILGPDLGAEENVRLFGLLSHATRARKPMPTEAPGMGSLEWDARVRQGVGGPWVRLERHAMWAEDFLSLVPRTAALSQPEVV